MKEGTGDIREKMKSFNRKYYLNIFIKGTILSLSILFTYFLLAAVLEHNLWMGAWIRFLIFFSFFLLAGVCIIRFLKEPLSWWLIRKGLSEEQTARIIGESIPEVKDRLLNLVQLSSQSSQSPLAFASIQQKSKEFEPITFDAYVNLQENKKYLKYLFVPLAAIFAIIAINSQILTKSTARLIHFNQQYSPQAPFQFVISNAALTAFFNEDFNLEIHLEGGAIPEDAYIVTGNSRFKLDSKLNGEFTYVFEKLQEPISFQIEAAGFFSESYRIGIVNRPEITLFKVELQYPTYLHKTNDLLVNAGNLEVPEGTEVSWELQAGHTNVAEILFLNDSSKDQMQNPENQKFTFVKKLNHSDKYEIILSNESSRNKDRVVYEINVIKDAFPQISLTNLKDSVLYKRVLLGGMVSDDHGITQLSLHYRVKEKGSKFSNSFETVNIQLLKNQVQQSFYYNWDIDSIKLEAGNELEYFVEVWDNDGVNGRKSTKTAVYNFSIPDQENLIAEISKSQSQTEQKIDESVSKANKLHDQIEQANQKMKGKQTLDWQDKKMLEDIVQQKQSLDNLIEQLKEENKLLEDKKDAFTEQDERIREKAKQIQKLMDELLDEETKKLFEELQKLLKENSDVNQMQKILDKLNQNSKNLEKELERTLELFKQFQYDFKLDQAIEKLKKQIDEQKNLLKETEQLEKTKDNKSGNERGENGKSENKNFGETQRLAEEQKSLKEQFEKLSEELNQLDKLGEELNKNDELPSSEDADEVKEQQEQSQQMLEQNQPSKSKGAQQKSLNKMQKMQSQMASSQNEMMMEVDMQNLETLRQIIHGLVKLSFDEEILMKNFSELNQNDPRFNKLAQHQIKLKDDVKVLEDSLLALGKRDPFMGSIVSKEVGELNSHLDKVVEANKERRKPQASSEMQSSMTSINNLALMLDSHYDMMMQMMANAQPSMKKSKQKGQKPSLSQMQQQLNQKIEQLKGSGKTGRELSEELAEMAAEQERIRRALQEMQEKMKDGQLPGGNQLPSKMEQTEMDLVNKQITDQLIRRQQEILTRLLETEKSTREQEMDEERKGETAKDYDKEIPKAFEDYLRLKEKEVELLKTVPPRLYPYYKKEVNDYFKRMGNQ